LVGGRGMPLRPPIRASSLREPVAQGGSRRGARGRHRRARGRRHMRDKLALTIALASFAVVTALGVGFAGAEGLSGSEDLGGSETIALEAPEQCEKGTDDDGEGLVDAEAPGCQASNGASEESGAPAGAPEEGNSVEAPAESGLQEGTTIHAGGEVHRNQPLG